MSYRRHHVKTKVHKIRPKKPLFLKPWFWAVFCGTALILLLFYFFLFYSGLQVKNILVSGNQKIKTSDLQSAILNKTSRKLASLGSMQIFSKSIFLVDKRALATGVLNNFPGIEKINIIKKFPETLLVDVQERQATGIYCSSSDKCFFIDDFGVIFEELGNVTAEMFIVRQAVEQKEAFVGENVIAQNIINAISTIEKNIRDNFKIEVKEAMITSPIRLDIKTSENWQIFFNTEDGGVDEQLAKLDALLASEIPPEARKNLEYIDLRFKDRAYYK